MDTKKSGADDDGSEFFAPHDCALFLTANGKSFFREDVEDIHLLTIFVYFWKVVTKKGWKWRVGDEVTR
jgi:hypothetical protein